MWRSRKSRDRRTVICIACGDSVLREDAREYDKEGDRWNRRDKEFEYLCTDCDNEICHQPRDGLESLITSIESDGLSRGVPRPLRRRRRQRRRVARAL